jgi:glutathione S-transferase
MGYRLYGWRQTGSMAVEAALDVAGIAHDFVPVSRKTDENLGPAFTAINPRQQLPALVCPDGTVVTEGPAILSHLADAHPEAGLIPAPGSSARARHDRWMAFLHANVYEAMLRELRPANYTDDPAGAPAVKSAATAYVKRHFEILDGQLGPGPYLTGAGMQTFDIYLWMLTWWVDTDWLSGACPGLFRLREAAQAHPALAAVWVRHFG